MFDKSCGRQGCRVMLTLASAMAVAMGPVQGLRAALAMGPARGLRAALAMGPARGLRAALAVGLGLALFASDARAAESAASGKPHPVTSEKEKAQVSDGLVVQLRELYVESGADRKTIETGIRAQARQGAYRELSGEGFARALETDLRKIGRDEHFRVVYYAGQVPPQPTSFVPTPQIRARQRPMFATGYNNGFTTTTRLDGTRSPAVRWLRTAFRHSNVCASCEKEPGAARPPRCR